MADQNIVTTNLPKSLRDVKIPAKAADGTVGYVWVDDVKNQIGKKSNMAATGSVTAVTNLLSSPTAINGAAWSNATAGAVKTATMAQMTGGGQIGQSYHVTNSPNFVLIGNHKYLAVVIASAENSIPSPRFPCLYVTLTDGSGGYLVTMDNDSGTSRGNKIMVCPEKCIYTSTFYSSPAPGATPIFAIADSGENGSGVYNRYNLYYAGLYDVTGMSGVVYDSASDIFIDLDASINIIGDSFANAFPRVKDALELTNINILGEYIKSGVSYTSGTAVVTMESTVGLSIGNLVTGNGIPVGTAILTINSSTQVTLTANTTKTISNGIVKIGYYPGGKTSTQILAAWQDALARDASLADKNSLIWVCHNDSTNSISLATAKSNILAIVSTLNADFRVLTNLYNSGWVNPRTSNADFTDALNRWMINYFGDRCIDVRDALSAHATTAQDVTDVSWGLTPASIRIDAIHLSIFTGQQAIIKSITDSVNW